MTAPFALGLVMYAIKRLYGFPLELKVHRAQLKARVIRAQAICDALEQLHNARNLAEANEAHRDLSLEERRAASTLDSELRELQTAMPRRWIATDGALADDLES